MAAEIKLSDAPRMSKSIHSVLGDLELDHLYVVHPGDRTYPMADRVTAVSIRNLETCRPSDKPQPDPARGGE